MSGNFLAEDHIKAARKLLGSLPEKMGQGSDQHTVAIAQVASAHALVAQALYAQDADERASGD